MILAAEDGYAERTAQAFAETAQMRSHWWRRPGWRVGRSAYTYHVIFDDSPAVAELARHYQRQLDIPALDAVPLEWLHLTTQGIGFTDEVDDDDLRAITRAVRRHVAEQTPFTITLGGLDADPEGVALHVAPWAPLLKLRYAVRAGIGDVWGIDNIPEAGPGFVPHVTVGYSNGDGPTGPVQAAIAATARSHLQSSVRAISLLKLNRDDRVYRWQVVDVAQLGRPA